MIGLANNKVILVDYSARWKDLFSEEEKILSTILAGLYDEIQHVGSTSIPGMCAKPIIDVAIGTSKMKMKKVKEILIERGYEYVKNHGDDDRLFFAKGPKENRMFNIHVEEYKGKSWNNHVLFRDYLISNPGLIGEYENLKRYLLSKYREERDLYTQGKNDFIQEVIKQAYGNNKT